MYSILYVSIVAFVNHESNAVIVFITEHRAKAEFHTYNNHI